MTLLRNVHAPASGGGHEWPDIDKIHDVDPVTAHALLKIADAGFVEVLPGDDGHPDTPAMRAAEIEAQAALDEQARDAEPAAAVAAAAPASPLPANWRPLVAPVSAEPPAAAPPATPTPQKPAQARGNARRR